MKRPTLRSAAARTAACRALALLAAAASATAPSCTRAPSEPTPPARETPPPTHEPSERTPGDATEVPSTPRSVGRDGETRCYVVGAQRVSVSTSGELHVGDEVFAGPIVVASRASAGWVFVDAQGIAASAEQCTGPLRRLPAVVHPPQQAPVATRGRVALVQPDGLYTTDGSTAFSRVDLPVNPQAIITAAFADARRGVVLIDGGAAWYTDDAGAHWREVPMGPDAVLDVRSTATGLAVETLAGLRPLRDDGTAADAITTGPDAALEPGAPGLSCDRTQCTLAAPTRTVALSTRAPLTLEPLERAAQEIARRATVQHQHLAHDRAALEPGAWELRFAATSPRPAAGDLPSVLVGPGAVLTVDPARREGPAVSARWRGIDALGAPSQGAATLRAEALRSLASPEATVHGAGPRGALIAHGRALSWLARGAGAPREVPPPGHLGTQWPDGAVIASAPLGRQGIAFVYRSALREGASTAYIGVALGPDGGVLGTRVMAFRSGRIAGIGRWADAVYLVTAHPRGDDWRASLLTMDGPQQSTPAWPVLATRSARLTFCTEPTETAPGALWLARENLGVRPLRVTVREADAPARPIEHAVLRIAAAHTGPCVTHALALDGARALRVSAASAAPQLDVDDGAHTAHGTLVLAP